MAKRKRWVPRTNPPKKKTPGIVSMLCNYHSSQKKKNRGQGERKRKSQVGGINARCFPSSSSTTSDDQLYPRRYYADSLCNANNIMTVPCGCMRVRVRFVRFNLGIPLADPVFICAFDNFVRIMASRVSVMYGRVTSADYGEGRREELACWLGGQLEIRTQGDIYIHICFRARRST